MFKLLNAIILGGLIIFNMSTIFPDHRLKDVQSYKIYYSNVDEAILKDMAGFDMMIVESLQFTKAEVDSVKNSGDTLMIGYISVMEIGEWDNGIRDLILPADLLETRYKKLKRVHNGLIVGDITQSHYQDVLLDMIETRIVNNGMDGIFLDTVDQLEHYDYDLDVKTELHEGYRTFLIKLRERYPEFIVIQNRGFKSLYDFSYEYIDGFLWEDFDTVDQRKGSVWKMLRLNILRVMKGFDVLTSSYENEKENLKTSNLFGWKHTQVISEDDYMKWRFEK